MTLPVFRRAFKEAGSFRYSTSSGLFGIEGLKDPQDWIVIAGKALERCKELAEGVTHLRPSVETIKRLDDISDTVCQVHDAAEFCWNVHTDHAWRKQAQQACILLGGYVNELNQNKDLYDALGRTMQHYERLTSNRQASTSLESSRLANQMKPVEGFTTEAVMVGRLLLQDFEKAGIHLPHGQQAEFARVTAHMTECGMGIRTNIVRSDHQTLKPRSLLFHYDEEKRKQGFKRFLSIPKENGPLLDGLQEGRQHLASLLGYASYAEYALDSGCLAQKPVAVTSFLENLNDALQPQLDGELKMLAAAKATLPKDINTDRVEIWDRDICLHLVKAQQGAQVYESAGPYFHINRVLEGLTEIAKRTFDVDMKQIPLSQGEGWASDVIKLRFSNPEEGPLGELYIDPLARRNKLAGSAHFTLRCKKLLSSGKVQQPLAALAFDFGSLKMAPGEMKVFFHEFGHALHTILSRAEFQHLAGTRGPMDMVEIPSHFFEHFLQDKACLSLCGRHYATGEAMPSGLQDAVQQFWSFMPALDMNETVVNAAVDQAFHGERTQKLKSSSAVSEVMRQFSAFDPPEMPGVQCYLRFGHLVTYAASYYAYPYAKFIASAIWEQNFAEDPFCREAGVTLRDKLLGLGGAKPPAQLIEDLLGKGSLDRIGGGFAPSISFD